MSWRDRGRCRVVDAEALFAEGVAQEHSKRVCAECPVVRECLAYALDERIKYGVWGGMTERERRALLRRRPAVASWSRLIESAQKGRAANSIQKQPVPRNHL
ncbi:WhiB family transcriptional regulator [Streptomyces sp. IB201691-2A2]|uniref:WhiB family transcriptional regulator n=1 Tax=Streptomyces sp. IB201691-2A2 TaxID=2561920 RepID=UPI0028C4CE27|nr:WhiB family transcriptional regulator [Streptomyces sp. IB201691-2A2]